MIKKQISFRKSRKTTQMAEDLINDLMLGLTLTDWPRGRKRRRDIPNSHGVWRRSLTEHMAVKKELLESQDKMTVTEDGRMDRGAVWILSNITPTQQSQ